MRGPTRALAYIGGVVALSAIPAPAQATAGAAATQALNCQVVAVKPTVDNKGVVRGEIQREGCERPITLRVRLIADKPGSDPILASASRTLINGAVTTTANCTSDADSYYVVALGRNGLVAESQAVKLSCGPGASPSPSVTPTRPQPTPTRPTPSRTPTRTPTATPTSTVAPTASPEPTETDGLVGTAIEREVVRLTNDARRQNGCQPVTADARLRAAAAGHSKDMADRGYFSHTSPEGKNPGDRIKASGFTPMRGWGENIAMGQRTAEAVVKGWLNSAGHRANMLNCAHTHIGVGHHAGGAKGGPYWTQVFAR
ncbi:CAP domain-containing protein [Sinosporangium siamense]|uniref:SCP domain-containing protein n=1 Tax=Sinosporangium siamense TaxID=1367973 RepID=A0A919REW6_9ACTN|nr:CAP domain-containing protein [Sinosporangium siamense]GII92623.1 hypothetical protein Ssi02_28540 [Sinosporangium siamense]